MANNKDIDLMAHFDRELGDDVGDTAPAAIDKDKLRGLSDVSELVRGHLEMQADETPDFSAAMWSKIESRLNGADEVRGSTRSSIVVEDRSSSPGERSSARQDTSSGSRSWNASAANAGWFARHRAHIVTGMASAGVVAAIALWMRPHAEPTTNTVAIAPLTPSNVIANPDPRNTVPVIVPVALAKQPTDVEALDVSDGSGTVMTIADEDGETAVIWISPKDVEGL
jgi:hypothetical protein